MRARPILSLLVATLGACSVGGEPAAPGRSPAPEAGIHQTRDDLDRIVGHLESDPERAVELLEQAVAGSVASLSEQQFKELGQALLALLERGELRALVRAGRARRATSAEVLRLLDDLEAWDAVILRGVDTGY